MFVDPKTYTDIKRRLEQVVGIIDLPVATSEDVTELADAIQGIVDCLRVIAEAEKHFPNQN